MRRMLLFLLVTCSHSFVVKPSPALQSRRAIRQPCLARFSTGTDTSQSSVEDLKKVLEREYVSFFDPFEKDYYDPSVVFTDPLTSLSGVDGYANNVDMLSGRTLMGSLLFDDAGIVLHSVSGGARNDNGSIQDITTRWTLRFTFKALPWKPTARFTGISVYQVRPGGPKGVQITSQTDYWDSIDLQQGGSYERSDKGVALKDFLGQISPGFAAPSAGPELPYQLLRRAQDYEVRRYPSYSAIKMPYERREDAFSVLGSVTRGMNPLSPALMQVAESGKKTMSWPLSFAPPGTDSPPIPDAASQAIKEEDACEIVTIPAFVVGVGSFKDASVEPVVRKADAQLRAALRRDNLEFEAEKSLQFAQYDAVYSMGQRRGEVWVPLSKHPWN